MTIRCLAVMTILATMAAVGCGGDDKTSPAEPIAIQGNWLYLGPWDGEHKLEISSTSMVYSAISGDWSSRWTIKANDNGLKHFQIAFDSGTGSYLPTGQSLSGAYVLDGAILTVQLANGTAYPKVDYPGSCTDGSGTKVSDCRLYMKQ